MTNSIKLAGLWAIAMIGSGLFMIAACQPGCASINAELAKAEAVVVGCAPVIASTGWDAVLDEVKCAVSAGLPDSNCSGLGDWRQALLKIGARIGDDFLACALDAIARMPAPFAAVAMGTRGKPTESIQTRARKYMYERNWAPTGPTK